MDCISGGWRGGRLLVSKISGEAFRQAERCWATGCAARVNSIISPFCSMLGDQERSFPAIQGVEVSWRELSGIDEETVLRREVLPDIDDLSAAASGSNLPGAAAVVHALRAARLLLVEWSAQDPQYSKVSAESLAVALEFDRARVAPPDGHGSWLDFELIGQAALVAQVFESPDVLDKKQLFTVRLASGAGAMPYLYAFESWIGS